jgi:hypothetical protein
MRDPNVGFNSLLVVSKMVILSLLEQYVGQFSEAVNSKDLVDSFVPKPFFAIKR